MSFFNRANGAPPQPFGFWTSAGWALAAMIAWAVAQLAAALIARTMMPAQEAGAAQAVVLLAITLVATPAPVIVLWLAVRRAGRGFCEYLALNWPSRFDLILGLGCLVILLPLGDLASHLSGRDVVPPFVVEAYKHARDAGALPLLVVTFVIAAPAMEEIIFRGFLLRGFAETRIGVVGAILLTSLCWASLHVQYEVFFIVQILVIGVVFGWLRWRSGSTGLTLFLHCLINLTALLQTAYIVERMAG